MDDKLKYLKYLNKNKIGGEIFDYNFCSLWINKVHGNISDENLEKINNFAQLIKKYNKTLILYIDSFLTANINELQKMNIEIVDIRVTLQQLYPVEQDFANNLSLQKELFTQNSDKKSINHIIHCILHPDIPLWTRIDFTKPLILLHDTSNKPENYFSIFSDLDLMDDELYQKYIDSKKPSTFTIDRTTKYIKNLINWYYTGIDENGFKFDYEKITKEKYDEYMIKVDSINETNYKNIIDELVNDLRKYRQIDKYPYYPYELCILDLRNLNSEYKNYIEEKNEFDERNFMNCVSNKVLALDKKSIFTDVILENLNKYGLIAQNGANNNENSFYIIKNTPEIKHNIDAIFIKEVAYFVMTLKNYFSHIYNDKLFKDFKKFNELEKKIIDIYLWLYNKIINLMSEKKIYNFLWDVKKINDKQYLNMMFGMILEMEDKSILGKMEDPPILSTMYYWAMFQYKFDYETNKYVYDNSAKNPKNLKNLICMLSEISKFTK
ncbi:hypothetical protein BMW23_0296 [Bodo saltans virus]|uniref:Uncharacterized protein n=1 Tax=Bodo saltans virus TaxID=2024608 RepID=A0A2H4UU04_9VIRU|nr:hypothetical protein QJ851_gp0291 [Bodo saltans virus]ATZ80354.1 hypothetical protein BMW23_0296 [Bodo saltans virus]